MEDCSADRSRCCRIVGVRLSAMFLLVASSAERLFCVVASCSADPCVVRRVLTGDEPPAACNRGPWRVARTPWRPNEQLIRIVDNGRSNVNATTFSRLDATTVARRSPDNVQFNRSRKSNSPGDPLTGRRRTVSPPGNTHGIIRSRSRISSSVFRRHSLWQTLPVGRTCRRLSASW